MNERSLTEYLARQMPAASAVKVSGLKRISGGSSRETYAFDLEWIEPGGERRSRPLIARRDPTGGLLQSSREREFNVLRAMYRAGLKVPEPLYLELDPSVIERPFFVMARAEGRVSTGAFPASEPAELQAKVADQFLEQLASLQKLDYRALGLESLGEPHEPGEPARAQTALMARDLRARPDAGALPGHVGRVRMARSEPGRDRSCGRRSRRLPLGKLSLRR